MVISLLFDPAWMTLHGIPEEPAFTRDLVWCHSGPGLGTGVWSRSALSQPMHMPSRWVQPLPLSFPLLPLLRVVLLGRDLFSSNSP